MKLHIGHRLGLLGVGLVAAAVAVLPGSGAAESRHLTRWLGSWAASPWKAGAMTASKLLTG